MSRTKKTKTKMRQFSPLECNKKTINSRKTCEKCYISRCRPSHRSKNESVIRGHDLRDTWRNNRFSWDHFIHKYGELSISRPPSPVPPPIPSTLLSVLRRRPYCCCCTAMTRTVFWAASPKRCRKAPAWPPEELGGARIIVPLEETETSRRGESRSDRSGW